MSHAFRAAWVFPVAGPPLRDGVLEIDDLGVVAAVRPGPDADAIDLGGVAIAPALVNAHVHLEFSDLPRPIGPPAPFSRWLKQVVAHRRDRAGDATPAIAAGLAEAARTGTAAVGEIATADLPDEAYAPDGPDAVLFREVIGPRAETWDELLRGAETHLDRANSGPDAKDRLRLRGPPKPQACAGRRLAFGLSPHAPHTVPQGLFERLVRLAVGRGAAVATHLAETAAERELLADGTGDLVDLMRAVDLWRPDLHPRGRRPLDWIETLAAAPRGLVVHGNYLDDEELDALAAAPSLALVYCPRTHAYFGHPPHPFRKLLDRGGRVALGTDGRSSNPDLDLWSEARFVRRLHPDLPTGTLLEMVTRAAAEALGLADRRGTLAPGRPADFLAVRLADPDGPGPPDLFGEGNIVARLFRRGVEVGPR